VSIVVPTLCRPSLDTLVRRLAAQVDGAPVPVEVLAVPDPYRAGPARARNRGWSAARYEWVAFLDDDVLPEPDWFAALLADLDQPPDVGGVQGVISVPCSARPDDWERTTAGLARAAWATADMAYRRAALEDVSGFDERFPRAYREDADLAYRVRRHGWRLVTGARRTVHPVRPAGRWVSLAAQRGNADDALLRRLHGPDWHRLLAAPAGRRHRHAVVVGAGLAAVGLAVLARCPATTPGGSALPVAARPAARLAARRAARLAARVAAAAWLAGTAEFAAARARRAPGSDPVALVLTSVLIPPLAIGHWMRGWLRYRGAPPWPASPRPGLAAGRHARPRRTAGRGQAPRPHRPAGRGQAPRNEPAAERGQPPRNEPAAGRGQAPRDEQAATGVRAALACHAATGVPADAPLTCDVVATRPGPAGAGPAPAPAAPAPEATAAASPASSPSRSVYPHSPRETASHVRISAARPAWRSVRRGAVG
jgi:hypothetical protein